MSEENNEGVVVDKELLISEGEAPTTTADAMRWVASWLDDVDVLLSNAYPELSEHLGTEVQRDLRNLAEYLDLHGDLDDELYEALTKDWA